MATFAGNEVVIVIVKSRVGTLCQEIHASNKRKFNPIGRFYMMDILIIWSNIVNEVPTTVLPMRMTMKELKKKVIHSANNFNIAAFLFIKNKECRPS